MHAIILRRADFKENDQLITLLTLEKGKLTALARGVKKIISKNSAYLEPFFFVEADIIPGRDISHLAKAIGLDSFKNIRSDLDKSVLAVRTLLIVDGLLEEKERDPSIFRLLLRWLQYADQNNISRSHFFGFIVRFFNILGFRPFFNKCFNCGRPVPKNIKAGGQLFFSPASGGLICRECRVQKKQEKFMVLKAEDVRLWQNFFEHDVDAWPDKISLALEKAIRSFSEYHSEKKLDKIRLI